MIGHFPVGYRAGQFNPVLQASVTRPDEDIVFQRPIAEKGQSQFGPHGQKPLGRQKQGGEAITVLNVDSPVTQEVLEKIKRLDNILSVKLIKL
ncbi:MAG: hypothetical protein NC914_03605 [Candidatus Omnitrophica bacterium]|nr:hypothetical protein [Candidatus Omnitrophota bacterium]